MDKSIDRTKDSHSSTLSSSQQQLIRKLQSDNHQTLSLYPDFNTQWNLARFCEGRNWHPQKTQKMLSDYFEYRKRNNYEEIRKYDFSELKEIIYKNYASGFCHVDKEGRPVLYERIGHSNTKELISSLTTDEIRYYYILMLERFLHVKLPICSKIAGRRVEKMVLIYDFKGVNMTKMFDSDFKNFLKNVSKLGQEYYPETLHLLVMVNVSIIIRAIWNTVKFLLDKDTRRKIKMFSGNGTKELLKYIDKKNLPEFLGGECKDDIRSHPGPWKKELEAAIEDERMVLKDRKAEFDYFFTEEERKNVVEERKVNFNADKFKLDWSEGELNKGEVRFFIAGINSLKELGG